MNTKLNYWVRPAVKVYRPTPEGMVQRICDHFGVNLRLIKSSVRRRAVVDARRVVCYMLHVNLGITLMETGAWVNRDHSTVLYSCQKVRDFMDIDREYKELINKFI